METSELEVINPKEYGLEEKTATELTTGLKQVIAERELLIGEFETVSKLEVSEETIPKFKALRLKIQKNRTQGINNWHKVGKEYFLRGGQFLDAIKRKENAVNEAMEDVLMNGEKHFENLEKERLAELQVSRELELSKYIEDASERDLSSMDEDVWAAFLGAKKGQYEARVAAEKKAEAEQIEAARIDKLHQERKEQLIPMWKFVPEAFKALNMGMATEMEFRSILDEAIKNQTEYEQELERVSKDLADKEAAAEKERLEREKAEQTRLVKEKAEKEDREKLISSRTKEMQPYAQYIRDFDKMLNMPAAEYKKELADVDRGARESIAFEAKRKAEQEAKIAKDAADEAREKAKREALADAKAAKQAELSKGDEEKFQDLLNDLSALKTKYTFKSEENIKMYQTVGLLLDKVINHIKK